MVRGFCLCRQLKTIRELIAGSFSGAVVSKDIEARSLAFESAEVRDGFFRWIFFRTFLRN
jgi:hypothetical protein